MSRGSIERRLIDVSNEIKRTEQELAVIDEQLAHFAESADDARVRALVSETPLAAKEHREAVKTVTALSRDRESWALRLRKLEERQNGLLDEMLEEQA